MKTQTMTLSNPLMRAFLAMAVGAQLTGCAVHRLTWRHAVPFQNERHYFAKGGVWGVCEGAYAIIDSPNNELLLADGQSWVGQPRAMRECVLVSAGQVTPLIGHLPESKRPKSGAMVAFERNRVWVYNFGQKWSGYYPRQDPE